MHHHQFWFCAFFDHVQTLTSKAWSISHLSYHTVVVSCGYVCCFASILASYLPFLPDIILMSSIGCRHTEIWLENPVANASFTIHSITALVNIAEPSNLLLLTCSSYSPKLTVGFVRVLLLNRFIHFQEDIQHTAFIYPATLGHIFTTGNHLPKQIDVRPWNKVLISHNLTIPPSIELCEISINPPPTRTHICNHG